MIPITDSCNSTYRPRRFDLFSGVGGLSLGMEAAGFEVALAVEKDPRAAAQYRQNFPNTQVICNAVDFGVPQSHWRLFWVGNLEKKRLPHPHPTSIG